MSGLETVGTCVLLVVLTIVLAVSMIWVCDRIGDWSAGKDDDYMCIGCTNLAVAWSYDHLDPIERSEIIQNVLGFIFIRR